MDHRQWLEKLINGDSYRTAARKIGIDQSTITKQLSRGGIRPENVIAFARAYGRKAADELVATGYLKRSDVEGLGVEEALKRATNLQLLTEIDRRMSGGTGEVFKVTPSNISGNRDDPHLRAVSYEHDDDQQEEDDHGYYP
ncbi:transcriptional regulator [Rhodococcus zopfii]|uniref:Transcriptional regulator n=1 Tax=Rhodococcus zopfii TaxID=43772 RepID=A0ABU3WTU0_9NOCA|nr:transcriptional regulator [Rhodococcus zopfii]